MEQKSEIESDSMIEEKPAFISGQISKKEINQYEKADRLLSIARPLVRNPIAGFYFSFHPHAMRSRD